MLHIDVLLFVCAVLPVCVNAEGSNASYLYLLLLCTIDKLQFLSLDELASTLPPYDDDTVAVSLPVPLPLGNETVTYYTTAYVSLYVNST